MHSLHTYLHGLVQPLSKVARAVTHTLHCVAKIHGTVMTQLKPVTAICTFTLVTCKFLVYIECKTIVTLKIFVSMLH